jgi:4-methylaminobutanoate oxidase (formaldehyde-forming)
MHGHTLGRPLGMGYVSGDARIDAEFISSGTYEIEIAGRRYPATASLRPFYDPKSERIRVDS